MKIIDGPLQKVAIHSWAERVDKESLACLATLARSDRLSGPIAVMPDVHSSGDVCVGTILVASACVLPTSIGGDLGCGMCCQSYPLEARGLNRAALESLVEKIMDAVPAGRRLHDGPQPMPGSLARAELSTRTLCHDRSWLAPRHLGTLGGGNHFIELQRATDGQMWVSIHSGSRGIGAAIAAHHARSARALSREAALPWLELGSVQCGAFLCDLKWALEFAAHNRRAMLDRVTEILARFTGTPIAPAGFFDVPHNVIAIETVDGAPLVVHRKGAMPAHAGSRGLIPGSMGSASYIVEGLGNPAAYQSCSHGAGRRLSRGEAQRRISPRDFRRQMGNVVFPRGARAERALIEEAPAAYKDIKEVLQEQAGLARPLLRLEPLAVVKGV